MDELRGILPNLLGRLGMAEVPLEDGHDLVGGT
jgi:hypothetical protein